MTNAYKVLGQEAPAATTNVDLLVMGVGKSVVTSSLVICNRGTSTKFRLAVRTAGAALVVKHYLFYDAPIDQYDSLILPLGMTLTTSDVVTIYSETDTLSFTLFGSEITA